MLGRPISSPNPSKVESPGYISWLLIEKKSTGMSWYDISKELSTENAPISPALVWKVAHGHCNSKRIEVALGLKPKQRSTILLLIMLAASPLRREIITSLLPHYARSIAISLRA